MGTIEKSALLSYKNGSDLVIIYPTTRMQDIDGLENASQNAPGLMSAEDKNRLDNIPTKGLEVIESTLKKDEVGWYFEEEDGSATVKARPSFYAITEDMVDVSTDDTKGVAPYNTGYGYTNITIHDDAGIEWTEGATFHFVVNTKLVVVSNYRNVRIRIGSGNYIPLMTASNGILGGNSFFVKNRVDFFTYTKKYQTGGALHLDSDNDSTTYLHSQIAAGTVKIDSNGYGARYSLIFPTTPLSSVDERYSSLVTSSSTGTTKAASNLTFYLDRHHHYIQNNNIAAGAASANTTYQDYYGLDLRYTANTNTTYVTALKKVFLYLKDFNEQTMTFKADATVGNIMTRDKIATRFPTATSGDVYLYFLGWTTGTWYQLAPNFTQINRVFKYTPSTGAMTVCNVLAG